MKLFTSPLGTKTVTAFVDENGETFFRTYQGVWLASLSAESSANVQSAFEALRSVGDLAPAPDSNPVGATRVLAGAALGSGMNPGQQQIFPKYPDVKHSAPADDIGLPDGGFSRTVSGSGKSAEPQPLVPDTRARQDSDKEDERTRFVAPPSQEERFAILEASIKELTDRAKIKTAATPVRYQGPGMIDLVYKMMDKIPDANSLSLDDLEEEECAGCCGNTRSHAELKASVDEALRRLGSGAVAGAIGVGGIFGNSETLESRPNPGKRVISLLEFLGMIRSGTIPLDAKLAFD